MAKRKLRPEIWNIFWKVGADLKNIGNGMGITEEEAIGHFLSKNDGWERTGLQARPANQRSKLFTRPVTFREFTPRDLKVDIGQKTPDWPAERANARKKEGQLRFA